MTSSKAFYEKLQEISFYFYENELIKEFENLTKGHTHGSEQANVYDHDATHNSSAKFHKHLQTIHPDEAKINMLILQSIVLLYFVIVSAIFIYQVVVKPRIQDSLKRLRC